MPTRWGRRALAAWALIARALGLPGATRARGGPQKGGTITVRVMSAKVMREPRFIGMVAGAVARGDELRVEEVQGDCYRVAKRGGASGWIHRPADAVGLAPCARVRVERFTAATHSL